MRKDVLLSLINQYEENKHTKSELFNKLKIFSQSDEIFSLPDDGEVSYLYFLTNLKNSFKNESQFMKLFLDDILKNKGEAVKLIKKFSSMEKKSAKSIGNFSQLPEDILDLELSKHLNSKDEARLSQVSTAFYNRSKKLAVWFDKLIISGCDKDVINDLQKYNLNINYKKLYEAVMRLPTRKNITLWQLLCLSGDPKTLSLALRLAPKDTKDSNGYNMLHLAALSGSLSAIEYAIRCGFMAGEGERLDPIFTLVARSGNVTTLDHICTWTAGSLDKRSYSQAILNAIKSQNINMIEKIYALASDHNRVEQVYLVPIGGRVHFKRQSPDVATLWNLKSVICALITENQDVIDYVASKTKDNRYFHLELLNVSYDNMLYAINSGSLFAVHYLTEILSVRFSRPFDLDLVKAAVNSGSLEMVKWVLAKLSVDEIQWLPDSMIFRDAINEMQYEIIHYLLDFCVSRGLELASVDKIRETVLHYAVITNSPEMVKFIRVELERNNISIDLNQEYLYGSVLDYAANNEEIKRALTEELSKSKLTR